MDFKALQEKIDRIAQGMPVMENDKVMAYQEADKGFKKMLNSINNLEKMVKENGFIEKKLVDAAGMGTARLQPLADIRQALSDAYDAVEDAYQESMGDFVASESTIAEAPVEAKNTFTVDTTKIDNVDMNNISEIIAEYVNENHPDLPQDASYSYSIVIDVDMPG